MPEQLTYRSEQPTTVEKTVPEKNYLDKEFSASSPLYSCLYAHTRPLSAYILRMYPDTIMHIKPTTTWTSSFKSLFQAQFQDKQADTDWMISKKTLKMYGAQRCHHSEGVQCRS